MKVPSSFSTTRLSAASNSDASAAPPAPACANNAPNDERLKAAGVVLRVNSQTEATLYDQLCVSSWREVLPLLSVTRTCVASKNGAFAAAPTSSSVDNVPNDEGPKAAEMVLRVNTETQTTN